MVQIGNVIVSLDVFRQKFCCDLSACHGICCVEGDAGAPLEEDEAAFLRDNLARIKPLLDRKAQKAIDEGGCCYTDVEGDVVTQIVDGRDCVFTCHEQGCCLCALEKHLQWKPISCHLYPIRISHVGDMEALNYHRWDVCREARVLGSKLDLPLYRFLEKPLVRRYGREWYQELLQVADELKRQNML